MAIFPERKEISLPDNESVQVRPEALPEKLEEVPGVQVVPTQFTKQVTDDQGQPLITTPQSAGTVVEIPFPEADLVKSSQGKIEDSRTWLARFFLRLLDKARHFHWQVTDSVNSKVKGINNV